MSPFTPYLYPLRKVFSPKQRVQAQTSTTGMARFVTFSTLLAHNEKLFRAPQHGRRPPPGEEGRAHPGEEGGAEGVHEERGAARPGGVHRRRQAREDGARRGRPGSPRENGGKGTDLNLTVRLRGTAVVKRPLVFLLTTTVRCDTPKT